MRVTLLHNPGAGDGMPAETLVAAVRAAGHDVSYHAAGADLGRDSTALGDVVLVAGGDGAIARAAVHFAGLGVPLALLPLGTANNIAKSLGALGETRALLAGLATAERRKLDIGVCRSDKGERRFVESAGGGLFTQLIIRGGSEVDENPSVWTGNEIDRGLQLLHHIVRNAPLERWRIEVDGEDLSGEYLVVEVMNIRLIGPNISLAPDADPGDGQLDVVLVAPGQREGLLSYVDARLHGLDARPDVVVRRGTRVRAVSQCAHWHLDDGRWPAEGEPLGEGAAVDVTLSVERAAIDVLVPARRLHADTLPGRRKPA